MSTSHRDQKCFFSTLYSDGGLFCYSAWVCTLSLLSVLTIVLRLFSLVCFGLLCYCFLFLDVKTVFVLTRFLLFFYFFCFVCLDCFLFVLPVKTVSLLSVLTSLFASFCFLFGFVLLGFFYFYLFFLFCLLFHLWRLYHWSRSSQVCLLRFVFYLALFCLDSFISISFFYSVCYFTCEDCITALGPHKFAGRPRAIFPTANPHSVFKNLPKALSR